MPGLLACSWARNKAKHAQELFERARDAYTRLKGLPCNSEIREADFRVARFALAKSPYPDIFRTLDMGFMMAAAGWWFDPDLPDDTPASLTYLANRYRQDVISVQCASVS